MDGCFGGQQAKERLAEGFNGIRKSVSIMGETVSRIVLLKVVACPKDAFNLCFCQRKVMPVLVREIGGLTIRTFGTRRPNTVILEVSGFRTC